MNDVLRTSTNLVIFAVLTLGILAYAGLNWARDAFFDDRYPVTVALPETGGLVTDQEVTLLGKRAGRISEIELTSAGVRMQLLIEPDVAIPEHVLVEITRRSAIGEQTLNLIPLAPDWEQETDRLIPRFVEVHTGWEPLEAGGELVPLAHLSPIDIPIFIENVEELFAAIDKDDLHTAIFEIGTAVRGRGETLVDLNRQAAELNTTLVAGIPDFERLIDSSGPILSELQASRDSIAEMITNLADLSDILADNRPVMERLVTESGTRALVETDALIRDVRADVSCLIPDFRDFNEATLTEGDALAQLMDLNQAFFGAVDIVFQWDPYRPKKNWARVADLLISGEAGGETYAERTPTPATRPGAACDTPFGLGVNAVRQSDFQPHHPTSPGIEWAPLMAESDAEGELERPDAAPRPREPLPATGGGLALAALGPLAAAYALVLRRRRQR